VCLELCGLLQVLAEVAVVVDFAVDGEEELAVVRGQRLSASVDTDNGQTLMAVRA
jgi:hypothetical protein